MYFWIQKSIDTRRKVLYILSVLVVLVHAEKEKQLHVVLQIGEQMLIQIDFKDKRPIYEQVIEKIQNLIVRGILPADEKIPSVRNLAIELSINPNTIQKAYQELERLGYIYTVKGRGNYVSPSSEWKNDRKDDYLEELSTVVGELLTMGVSKEEIIDLIKQK